MASASSSSETVTAALPARNPPGGETFALAWTVLLAFLRLATSALVYEVPFDIEQVAPLGSPRNLTTDAQLAALAIEHGAELCSSDADFSRFAGLRWRDPLRA